MTGRRRVARLRLRNERRARVACVAALLQVRRLVSHHLVDLRFAALIHLDGGNPPVHRHDHALQQRACILVETKAVVLHHHDLVVAAPVCLLQALAHREGVIPDVNIAAWKQIVIGAVVDDRYFRQPATAVRQPSGLVGSGTMVASRSKPPIRSLRSRNCSTEMSPLSTSLRPYWMPTLSSGRRAKPVTGSLPYTFTVWS